MRKLTAAALMLAGATVMGAEAHNAATRYSSERIWQRQSPVIERAMRRDPGAKQVKYNELRRELRRLDDSSVREKCIFETRFEAVLRTNGDEEEANKLISRARFEPFSHCSTSSQFQKSAKKWYSIAGAAAFLLGLYGMVRSAFRRKEGEHSPN
ncbi:hypothetical protein GF318_03445 [Candidatus Micrarchaeota archaeon]|nr:hypothetical protein [Candidatus Micrarchaeota archaeon]